MLAEDGTLEFRVSPQCPHHSFINLSTPMLKTPTWIALRGSITIAVFVCAALLLSACDSQDAAPADVESAPSVATNKALDGDYSDHTLILGFGEYITDPSSGEAGGITFYDQRLEIIQQDVGNGQLSHDFVYNDPRASWDNVEGISFGVKYGNTSSDPDLTDQAFWFEESLRTWENLQCSGLVLTENDVSSATPGLVENFFAGGGINIGLIEADVTQIGFRGVSAIFPAGTRTLGVAYTLFWVDGNGNLTDIDGNGKIDAAFREIYYNDQYAWSDNGASGTIDFPTVAIHEAGHGLSAAHFGTIGVKDGALFAAPRAVMNAIYGGPLRTLKGRDKGSHCSNWAQWPNN